QLSSGTTLNPLGNTYDGTLLTSSGDFFAMADKVADRVDASGLGYVQFASGEVFLTPASFWAASSTTSASVVNALAAAVANDTIRIKAGAYTGGPGMVNLTGLTANAEAGVSGVNFTLDSVDAIILAGAGDMDVTGNANVNTFNSNDGANAFTGSGAIDTATMGIPMPSSLAVSGGRIAVGADSVASIERLVFTDGTIAVIGATGSEYATLNGSLGSLTSGEKLFGSLAINSSTFATAAELDALTARFISGSTVSVDVLGMNATQLAAIAGNPTTSGVVTYPAVEVVSGGAPSGYFTTIQAAINFATAGDTINIGAGSYSENLVVSKRLTLDGATNGSGVPTTIVTSAAASTPVVSITGTGANATDRLVIRDMKLTGATGGANDGAGIRLTEATAQGYMTFENLDIVANQGAGVAFNSTAAVTDISIDGCDILNSGNSGIRIATAVPNFTGLAVSNTRVEGSAAAGFMFNPSSSLTNVGTGFDFTNCVFVNNNTANINNSHELTFNRFDGAATLTNVTVTGAQAGPTLGGYAIVFYGKGYTNTCGNVVLNGVTCNGNVVKGGLAFMNYGDVSNASLTNVDVSALTAPWGQLIVDHTSTATRFDAGNTVAKTLVHWKVGGTDARDMTFKSTVDGATLVPSVLADGFQIENQIVHAIDNAALGLARVLDGHLWVTTLSGTLANAIAASSDGDVIHAQNGVPVVLTAEITKSITFDGTFVINSSSIPTGPTATAVLTSFMTRLAPGATASANATGMSSDQLAAIAANASLFSSISSVTVTAALTAPQISSILADSSSVLVVATGMDAGQLNAVGGGIDSVATDGITGTMLVTSGVTDTLVDGLLSKLAVSAIGDMNADGMTDVAIAAMSARIDRVDEIYNLTLTNAQDASAITALLGKSVASASPGKSMAVAIATSMGGDSLNALGAAYLRIGTNGVGGSVLLFGGVTDANMTNLFTRIDLAADVRVDGTSMNSTTISILLANLAKIDSIYNIELTSAQNASAIASLLGLSDTASASAIATGMNSNVAGQLAKLADNYLKIRAAGISGAIVFNSNLTATQITNLLSRVNYGSSFVGGTTVTIDALGMTASQLSAIAGTLVGLPDPNAIFDIFNLTLTSAQNPTEIALLLGCSASNNAMVVATGMSPSQLAAVANNIGAVNLVTGQISITSALTSVQIAALVSNAAPGATVTVDTNGMDAAQLAALYSTSILSLEVDETVARGEEFDVLVNMSGLPTSAIGMQARV
ncbi:MAG: beta strand repeat-containing protein, partial [Planctomycetota bacterium]